MFIYFLAKSDGTQHWEDPGVLQQAEGVHRLLGQAELQQGGAQEKEVLGGKHHKVKSKWSAPNDRAGFELVIFIFLADFLPLDGKVWLINFIMDELGI